MIGTGRVEAFSRLVTALTGLLLTLRSVPGVFSPSLTAKATLLPLSISSLPTVPTLAAGSITHAPAVVGVSDCGCRLVLSSAEEVDSQEEVSDFSGRSHGELTTFTHCGGKPTNSPLELSTVAW